MTRQGIKAWASETVHHIFHGRSISRTFHAEIGRMSLDGAEVRIRFHERPDIYGKVDMFMNTLLPIFDKEFSPKDQIEITITKKL